MSTLWTARVVELDVTRCVIELSVVHPDAGPYNSDPVFAMRLLAEYAGDMELDGSFTPRGPLGDELRFGEAESESWCNENAARYIASVRVLDPIPPTARGANWRYPKHTCVRYELVATAPEWLAHLAVGAAWDSTVYS